MSTRVRPRDADEPRPRLELAQRELSRLVDGLAPDIAFNLVTFASRPAFWQDEPVLASRSRRASAQATIAAYRADGGTDVFAPLERLLDDAEAALESPREAPSGDFDTVFLLSDGAPTGGRIRDPDLLRAYVAERNRALRLRIHCIAFTDDPVATGFLRALAEDTGGTFVHPVRSAYRD